MINLIPDQVRSNNRYAYRNVRLVRYTAVSAFTMVAIAIITSVSILSMHHTQSSLQVQIDAQNQKLASFKPLEAQGKQLSDQLTTISSLLNRQVNFSGLLPSIAKIMPSGAILKELNFDTSDILPLSTAPTPGSSGGNTTTQKPFIILAAIKDRKVAATLLENIKANKDLFTDADLVDVAQNTAVSSDPTFVSAYPYQVTINAYLKKISTKPQTSGSNQ